MLKLVTELQSVYNLCLRFTADNQFLLGSTMESVKSQISFWRVGSWELERSLTGHQNSVNGLAINPEQTILASCSSDQSVKLWSMVSGELLQTLTDQKKVVATVVFSPDGQRVAAGFYGGRVVVWNTAGEKICAIKTPHKSVTSLVFVTPTQLAASGLGDDITLWSVPEGQELHRYKQHHTAVTALRLLDNGRTLVSWGYDKQLIWWNVTSGDVLKTLHIGDETARSIAFSPDEQKIAFTATSKIYLYEAQTGALLATQPMRSKALNGLAFSADGQYLAVGAADGVITIWGF
jgi:WD40 repeat protein